ncbi:MAG: 2-amino-4-hydroxy-6-hydroxymethyldihydropteridine diphosphokinase [Phycisphaerales bacterium JB040]
MNRAINNPCNRQKAAVALGSNVDSERGDRAAHLAFARDRIARLPGTTLLAASRDYETAPVGLAPGQDTGGPYLNAAVTLETSLSPRQLLDRLLEIERDRGRDRDREERWGPRTLDLDLILYADRVIDEPGLQVPHPRLGERLFVLEPLAEIAPGWTVPLKDATVAELLDARRSAPAHLTR